MSNSGLLTDMTPDEVLAALADPASAEFSHIDLGEVEKSDGSRYRRVIRRLFLWQGPPAPVGHWRKCHTVEGATYKEVFDKIPTHLLRSNHAG